MLGESYSRFFFGDDLQKLLLPGSAPYGLQQIIWSEQVVPCRSFRHAADAHQCGPPTKR